MEPVSNWLNAGMAAHTCLILPAFGFDSVLFSEKAFEYSRNMHIRLSLIHANCNTSFSEFHVDSAAGSRNKSKNAGIRRMERFLHGRQWLVMAFWIAAVVGDWGYE
jgi:hypothetical protein